MASVWRAFCDTFWTTGLWLPDGVTWDDLESPSPDIYYPRAIDINWSLAVGVVLLIVRYIYERFIIVPIAHALGVKDRKTQVPLNPVLEKAFTRSKGKITHAELAVLSKKTELSVREIERWLLKRRRKDAPSSMMKFREVSWHILFYTCAFVYGLYILWHRNWFWEIKYSVIGWPKLHVDGHLFIFYLVELGFYWSLLITSFTDVKRSDFTEQMIHHLFTISLIYLSWVLNYVRYGATIIVLHDSADFWLAASKMTKYSKHYTLCQCFFACFLVVWLVTRIGLYPFWVLRFIIFGMHDYSVIAGFAHKVFVGLLCGLQVLHIIWTYLILKILFQRLTRGLVNDVRSDSESSDNDSEDTIQEPKRASINGAKPSENNK